jgi:hypothetical protein
VQKLDLRSGCDLLVATPGRLDDLMASRAVCLSRMRMLVSRSPLAPAAWKSCNAALGSRPLPFCTEWNHPAPVLNHKLPTGD